MPGFSQHPLALTALAMVGARCLMAGVELGLFEALESRPLTLEELSEALECRPDGLRALLGVLLQQGAVELEGERYALTRDARTWMLDQSDESVTPLVRFNYDQWRMAGQLEQRLRQPVGDVHRRPQPDGFWGRYQAALSLAARGTAEEVAAALPLGPEPKSVLDVGGGHGEFARAVAARFPSARVTVLDLEPAARQGQEQGGPSDSIRFVVGDLRTADWGSAIHDAVLMLGVLPHLTPAERVSAVRRARAAVRPGGLLAVMTPRTGRPRADTDAAANVLYWLMTDQPMPNPAEVMTLLREAGFVKWWERSLDTAPASLFALARAPSSPV